VFKYPGGAYLPGAVELMKRRTICTSSSTTHLPGMSRCKFRDRLRADGMLAQKYAQLKRRLAARYGRDVREYSKGKTDFLASVLHA